MRRLHSCNNQAIHQTLMTRSKTYSDNLRVRHVATHAITPIHKNPSNMLEANHAGTLPATSETAIPRIYLDCL